MKKKLEKMLQGKQKPKIAKKDNKPDLTTIKKGLIKFLAQGKQTNLTCSHASIGSSDVFRFISGKYRFRYNHGRFMTPRHNTEVGSTGERAHYRKMNDDFKPIKGKKKPKILIQPFCKLPEVPIISACPDFYYKYAGNEMIIEIKTHTKTSECLTDRIKTQLWISMDAFNVEKAELHFYMSASDEEKAVYKTQTFHIKKQCRFFDEDSFKKVLPNLVSFITTFLEFNGIKTNKDDEETAKNELLNVYNKGVPKTKNYLSLNLICNKVTNNCKPLTSFVFPWKDCMTNLAENPTWYKPKYEEKDWQDRQTKKQKLMKEKHAQSRVLSDETVPENVVFDDKLRTKLFEMSNTNEKPDLSLVEIFKQSTEEINKLIEDANDLMTVRDEFIPNLIIKLFEIIKLQNTQMKSFNERLEKLETRADNNCESCNKKKVPEMLSRLINENNKKPENLSASSDNDDL